MRKSSFFELSDIEGGRTYFRSDFGIVLCYDLQRRGFFEKSYFTVAEIYDAVGMLHDGRCVGGKNETAVVADAYR